MSRHVVNCYAPVHACSKCGHAVSEYRWTRGLRTCSLCEDKTPRSGVHRPPRVTATDDRHVRNRLSKQRKRQGGDMAAAGKLTPQMLQEIVARRDAGETFVAIAPDYGVSNRAASDGYKRAKAAQPATVGTSPVKVYYREPQKRARIGAKAKGGQGAGDISETPPATPVAPEQSAPIPFGGAEFSSEPSPRFARPAPHSGRFDLPAEQEAEAHQRRRALLRGETPAEEPDDTPVTGWCVAHHSPAQEWDPCPDAADLSIPCWPTCESWRAEKPEEAAPEPIDWGEFVRPLIAVEALKAALVTGLVTRSDADVNRGLITVAYELGYARGRLDALERD